MLAIVCKVCCAAVPEDASGSVTVKEHRWGERLADFGGPFDVIVACGVLHFLVDLPVSNGPCAHVQHKLWPALKREICVLPVTVYQASCCSADKMFMMVAPINQTMQTCCYACRCDVY